MDCNKTIVKLNNMSLDIEYVKKLFNHLNTGENDKFFECVADDVVWNVMGTHPLAGTYKSKEDFLLNTFQRLNKLLKNNVILDVNNIIIQNNTAVVEMESIATAVNGLPFNNTYCWICEFKNNKIIGVRAYVDSALVQRLIDQNEL